MKHRLLLQQQIRYGQTGYRDGDIYIIYRNIYGPFFTGGSQRTQCSSANHRCGVSLPSRAPSRPGLLGHRAAPCVVNGFRPDLQAGGLLHGSHASPSVLGICRPRAPMKVNVEGKILDAT